jgi:hypothetical protein
MRFFLFPLPPPGNQAGAGEEALSEATTSMASINEVAESGGLASTVSAAKPMPMNRCPPDCPAVDLFALTLFSRLAMIAEPS